MQTLIASVDEGSSEVGLLEYKALLHRVRLRQEDRVRFSGGPDGTCRPW